MAAALGIRVIDTFTVKKTRTNIPSYSDHTFSDLSVHFTHFLCFLWSAFLTFFGTIGFLTSPGNDNEKYWSPNINFPSNISIHMLCVCVCFGKLFQELTFHQPIIMIIEKYWSPSITSVTAWSNSFPRFNEKIYDGLENLQLTWSNSWAIMVHSRSVKVALTKEAFIWKLVCCP